MNRHSPHSARLERWLGAEKIEDLSRNFRDWYGPPVNIRDVPGSVWITGGGDFVGDFGRGFFGSARDAFADHFRELKKRLDRERAFGQACFGVGFTSISDALAKASGGDSQTFPFMKTCPSGNVGMASTTWRPGVTPSAGATPSAAPGGNAPTSATAGAMPFTNPSSGTLHLTGADACASVISNSLLLYDRLFHVAKTMNSTSTEAVTGVPTRYQSQTSTAMDYIGGNFVFPEVGGTALAATAHNWTVCTYTDQGGAASTIPSIAGTASMGVERVDLVSAGGYWFMPLEAGDVGIKALTQMQCSALVATGLINFVIGHPIGIMSFPVINSMLPFDWLTNRQLAPRIFDNACLTFMELPKPTTTATNYTGMLYATRAA